MAARFKGQRSGALITAIIATLAMLGPFSIDTVFPAFDQIGREVGASIAEMQQVTSVYLLAFAVMSLLHGPISDAVGRKPVMVVGLLGYAAAAVVCALAPTLPILLIGRVLQGTFAGAGQILSRTIIRDLYEGPAAHKMMAQVGMIFAVAPAVAPIAGGLILGVGSWRIIFWSLAVLGVALAVAVAFGLPETHGLDDRRTLRITAVLVSLRQVLTDGPFLRLAFACSFGFCSLFLYIAAAPIIMLHLLGKGEHDFWMLFVPLVAGMILGSYLSARLAHRVSMTRLASIGFCFFVAAAIINVVLASLPMTHGLPWVLVAPPFVAFGMQLVFPILQLLMLDRFPHQRGAASSGQSFLTLVINAILTGVVAPIVATSMAKVAITSAGLGLLGAAFWVWHLRRRAGPRAD